MRLLWNDAMPQRHHKLDDARHPGRGFEMTVGKVEALHAGDPALLARTAEQTRQQMTSTLLQEIGVGAQQAATREMKVKIDDNRARMAIGLTPVNPQGKPEPAK